MNGVSVFYLFRDTEERNQCVLEGPSAMEKASHLFYGYPQLLRENPALHCNLPRPPYRRIPHFLSTGLNRLLKSKGHLETDFYSALCFLPGLRNASLIFATNDSVGLAPLWLRRWRWLHTPVVYTSIGMPERLDRLSPRAREETLKLLTQAQTLLCYGWEEALQLRQHLSRFPAPPPVHFVPFGVDCAAFPPRNNPKTLDILSIGADPMRDPALLANYLRDRPELKGMLIHGGKKPLNPPPNLQLKQSLPIDAVRDLIASARIVVLPVRENTYSGATTTLLQSLSMGAAVLVAATGALRSGYPLRAREHVCFYPPGDAQAFASELDWMLQHPDALDTLRRNGPKAVRHHLDSPHFAKRLNHIFLETLNVQTRS